MLGAELCARRVDQGQGRSADPHPGSRGRDRPTALTDDDAQHEHEQQPARAGEQATRSHRESHTEADGHRILAHGTQLSHRSTRTHGGDACVVELPDTVLSLDRKSITRNKV